MASLWELLDTSNLRYSTARGFTTQDSGHGPPLMGGWVRTGSDSGSTGAPGISNCHAWTSSSSSHVGSYVYLPSDWTADYEDFMGWAIATAICSATLRVWCIGDGSIVYLPLVMRNYTS